MYAELAPPPELKASVECLWWATHLEEPPAHSLKPILPDGCIDILVKLSEVELSSYVVGAMTTARLPQDASRIKTYLGVRFSPGGAFPLLADNLELLRDRLVALELLKPRLAQAIEAVLPNMQTVEQKLRCLGLLVQKEWHQRTAELDDRLIHARKWAHGRRGVVQSSALGLELGISRQHLGRLFKQQVGLSPKQFLRIVRFEAMVKSLPEAAAWGWADFACAFGFSDQSHFIADFKKVAGTTPGSFLETFAMG